MSRHILMVVTSADRLLNGEPTGLWLEEFAIPYQIFLDAGCRVRVASPQGGATPLDPRSVEDERPEWQRARDVLRDTEVLDTRLSARDFDAIFLAPCSICPGIRCWGACWPNSMPRRRSGPRSVTGHRPSLGQSGRMVCR